MRVKMLKTVRGSQDGVRDSEFVAGKEYDVTPHLGEVLVRSGEARLVITRPPRNVAAKPEEGGQHGPDRPPGTRGPGRRS